MAKKSKISVGGNPVRPGAEGVFAVPADRRLGRGLCLAEKPDLRAGPADHEARNSAWASCRTRTKSCATNWLLMRSPAMLEQRVKELNLGLVPTQSSQFWRLSEPVARV